MKHWISLWIVTAWCWLPGTALALVLPPGVYELHNHDDGSVAPPFYGLRLDGLDGVAAHDFTLDFDHPESSVVMNYNGLGNPLTISGIVYGGWDVGGVHQDPQHFQLSFTYTVIFANGDFLDAAAGTGSGFITPLDQALGAVNAGVPIALVDYAGNYSYSFRLGEGHRGHAGVSGWGWFNHEVGGLQDHVSASDWLFTVGEPIPEPSTLALFGLGALLTAWRARQR